jgi:hypothetical protein
MARSFKGRGKEGMGQVKGERERMGTQGGRKGEGGLQERGSAYPYESTSLALIQQRGLME